MHPWPWGLLTAGPSWFYNIKQNADIGSNCSTFWSKSLLNTRRKEPAPCVCFPGLPRHAIFIFFHTLAFECPCMLVTPRLESEAAINHVNRLHHTEVTEARERPVPKLHTLVGCHGLNAWVSVGDNRPRYIPVCGNSVCKYAFSYRSPPPLLLSREALPGSWRAVSPSDFG